jgi:outer membrane lipoprotein-sorting protein
LGAVTVGGILRKFDSRRVVSRQAVKFSLALCCSLIMVIAGFSPTGAAPTGDEIAAKVTDKLKEIQTVQADIVAELNDGTSKNPVKMTIRVTADRAMQVTRMEITQHPVFEGQIMILDTKKDQATVYMPVTGQAFRGKTSSVAAQLGVDLSMIDLNALLSMDTKTLLSCKYLRQEVVNRLPYHVVETRPKVGGSAATAGVQHVWVDAETYIVYRVEVYDSAQNKVATITMNTFKTNVKIDANKIRELPRGTKVTELK